MAELSSPLTNAQLEILKLFSTNMTEEELNELKTLIAYYYAQKAMNMADKIWDERGLTQEDMEKWLREKS